MWSTVHELRELENMLVPWVVILCGNALSVAVVQQFVLLFTTAEWRVVMCVFLAWHSHSVPDRLVLEKVAPGPDSPYSEGWIHTGMGIVIQTVGLVVLIIAPHTLGFTAVALVCLTLVWHYHQSKRWVYPESSSWYRALDVGVKTWVSLLSAASTAGFMYLAATHPLRKEDGNSFSDSDPQHTSRVFVVGMAWAAIRHGVRYTISVLLLDPHGLRGPVRVFTGLVLDLPILVVALIQSSLEASWTLMVCLALVDSLYLVASSAVSPGVARMFGASNLLWYNAMALSLVGTLRSNDASSDPGVRAFTAVDIMQRAWFCFVYTGLVLTVPELFAAGKRWAESREPTFEVHARSYDRRPLPGTLGAAYCVMETEAQAVQRQREKCGLLRALAATAVALYDKLPRIHAAPEDVVVVTDGSGGGTVGTPEFSESAVPTSSHVVRLLQVVSQSDCVCLTLWAIHISVNGIKE